MEMYVVNEIGMSNGKPALIDTSVFTDKSVAEKYYISLCTRNMKTVTIGDELDFLDAGYCLDGDTLITLNSVYAS